MALAVGGVGPGKVGFVDIYVGNLAQEVTEEDLRQAFGAYGQVASARVIMDRYSGQPRGFAFVEMDSRDEATAAIAGLNGRELKGRTMIVNEARGPGERRGGGARRY
jgi:RNA recognition motif-containing protein